MAVVTVKITVIQTIRTVGGALIATVSKHRPGAVMLRNLNHGTSRKENLGRRNHMISRQRSGRENQIGGRRKTGGTGGRGKVKSITVQRSLSRRTHGLGVASVNRVSSREELTNAAIVTTTADANGDALAPVLQSRKRWSHAAVRSPNAQLVPTPETRLVRRNQNPGEKVLPEPSVQQKKVVSVEMETPRKKTRISLNRSNAVILQKNLRVPPLAANAVGPKKRAKKRSRSTKKSRTKTNRKNLTSNQEHRLPANKTTATIKTNSSNSSSSKISREEAGVAMSRAEIDRDKDGQRNEEDD